MPLVLFKPLIGPLSDATTPGLSGPVDNGNERVLQIPQSSSIIGTSLSDCLVSYPGHSLEGDLTPLLSVYSKAPADWTNRSRRTHNSNQLCSCVASCLWRRSWEVPTMTNGFKRRKINTILLDQISVI